jgi:hypothetical protein
MAQDGNAQMFKSIDDFVVHNTLHRVTNQISNGGALIE